MNVLTHLNKFLFLCIFLLLMPNSIYAESTMSFSGSVVEKDSGLGLSNVEITLWRENASFDNKFTFQTKTNSKGQFFIDNLPKDKYIISVESEDNFIIDPFKTHPIETSKSNNVTDINISLETGCAIKGRVMIRKKIPIINYTYDVSMPSFSIISESSDLAGYKDGRFLLKGLTPGHVEMLVVPDFILSGKIFNAKCRKGELVDVGDLVYTIDKTRVIKGVVTDKSGSPISSVIIVARSDKHPGASYTTSGNGKFVLLNLDGQQYDLKVGSLLYKHEIIKNIKVPSKDVKITLELKPGAEKTPFYKKE